MDLQTRKLNFIRDFLKLESEKAISHLEKLLQKETRNIADVKPMTTKEFQKRIDQSSKDSQSGKLTENNKLISEIDQWS
jgi:DNA-directed RNA polymerase subunit F